MLTSAPSKATAMEAKTPEDIEAVYRAIGDWADPTWEQIAILYRTVGIVQVRSVSPRTGRVSSLSVNNSNVIGGAFPILLKTRQQAWRQWELRGDYYKRLAEEARAKTQAS